MDYEVIGAAVAVVGVLLWIRRDLRQDMRAMDARMHAMDARIREDLHAMREDLRALNGRIDAVLLADRQR